MPGISRSPAQPVILYGEYNATPPVRADGETGPIQTDVNGKLVSGAGGGGTTTIDTTVLAKEAKQDTQITAANAQTADLDAIKASVAAAATAAKQDLQTTALVAQLGDLDAIRASAAASATATKQDAQTADLDAIKVSVASADTKLSSQATGAKQDTGNTSVANIDAKFPAAAASADGEVAANSSIIRSRLFGFNGASWDRLRAGVTALSNVFTGLLNTLPWAIYHLAPVTRTDGQGGPLETDASGNLRVAVAASVEVASLASIDGKLTAQQGPNRGVNLWSTPVATTNNHQDLSAATQLLADIAAGKEFVLTAEGDVWYYFSPATSGHVVSATATSLALGTTVGDYIPSGQSTPPMTIPAGTAGIVTIGLAAGILRIRRVN